jgi:hypothetical protein
MDYIKILLMTLKRSFARYPGFLLYLFVFTFQFCSFHLYAQTLGTWLFNGNTNGSAGSYNTVSVADFSSIFTVKNYSGSLYYGENVWPPAAVNPAAYMEFSLAPVAGYALNLLNVKLNMRRSNTGTPAGSGPTSWNLRSSVDGYGLNLAAGPISHVAAIYTVTLPAGFSLLTGSVTFRVYGYNASTSTGGLSRMVFDDIYVNGSNIVLPSKPAVIASKYLNGQVIISAILTKNAPGETYTVERSLDAVNFISLNEIPFPYGLEDYIYKRQYDLPAKCPEKLFYRIATRQTDGLVQYSNITFATITGITPKQLNLIPYGKSLIIKSYLEGRCIFNLLSAAGANVMRKELFNSQGINSFSLFDLPAGIYYGTITNGKFRQTASVRMQ